MLASVHTIRTTVGNCKGATIPGLALGLAMPTPCMTNPEPAGSPCILLVHSYKITIPDDAVATAMERVTIIDALPDASETADTSLTFRVGSGATLHASFQMTSLLSYAYLTFKQPHRLIRPYDAPI